MANNPKILKSLHRRLNRLEDMACTHCGHDENVRKMVDYHFKIVEWVGLQLDLAYAKGEMMSTGQHISEDISKADVELNQKVDLYTNTTQKARELGIIR